LIHIDRKEYDQALHWFEQALNTNPLDKDAKNLIAELSEKLQNPDGSALPASDQTDEE
jgi:tetratricopeptide (TPR) repeat protein